MSDSKILSAIKKYAVYGDKKTKTVDYSASAEEAVIDLCKTHPSTCKRREPMRRNIPVHFVIAVAFFCGSVALSEGLDGLERITARFATLGKFLGEKEAVKEYGEQLKIYMGEGRSFDEVYKTFIEQLAATSNTVPGFAEKAWKPNPRWMNEIFVAKGEFEGSGLVAKRDALLAAVERVTEEAKVGSSSTVALEESAQAVRTSQLANELKSEYGILTKEEISRLSNTAKKKYNAQLNGAPKDGKVSLPPLTQNQKLKELSNFVAYKLLTTNEAILDRLKSGDADSVAQELERLRKPSNYEDAIQEMKLGVPSELIAYLKFEPEMSNAVLKAFRDGLESQKQFQHIADVRLNPLVIERLQTLHAQGIPPGSVRQHLSPDELKSLDDWNLKAQAIKREKTAFNQTVSEIFLPAIFGIGPTYLQNTGIFFSIKINVIIAIEPFNYQQGHWHFEKSPTL